MVNLELPPLRNRSADIPMLAKYFLMKMCEESGKQVDDFSNEAMRILQRYPMPGNVRELENIVERAVLLGKGKLILPEDLPESVRGQGPVDKGSVDKIESRSSSIPNNCTLKEALEGPERKIILDVLNGNNWNRNEVANVLGINRTTLYKKMKRLGLEDPRLTAIQQV